VGLVVLASARGMAQTGTATGALATSPDPTGYLAGFTITATVAGPTGGPVPTGTVALSIAGTQVVSGVSLVNGIAAYSPTSTQLAVLNVGTYAVTGSYSGDAQYAAATLVPTSITITQDTTMTTLVGVLPVIFYGQTIADEATEQTGPEPDGGTLDFYINGAVTCVLEFPITNGSCASQHTGEGYSVGNYIVQSVYSGDTNYTASSSPTYPVEIKPDPTSIDLASSMSPSTVGQMVTFTAKIIDIYTVGQGTVDFFDNGTKIGSGAANAQGVATFGTSSLAVGSHPITACLEASLNFLASSPCGAVTQIVNPVVAPPAGSFALTVNPASISVGVGNSVTVQVTVTALNGFNQPVQLGCGGLPNETTCTFVQTTIGAGGGSTTMIVSPAAPHTCGSSTPDFIAPNVKTGMAGLVLSVLAMLGLRRRRRWVQGLGLLVALCVLPWLGGCSSGCKDFGTEPTNYTFTVTGSSVGSSVGSPVVSQAVVVKMHVHL
jgi:MYXO-CTERM domain-containing protein